MKILILIFLLAEPLLVFGDIADEKHTLDGNVVPTNITNVDNYNTSGALHEQHKRWGEFYSIWRDISNRTDDCSNFTSP